MKTLFLLLTAIFITTISANAQQAHQKKGYKGIVNYSYEVPLDEGGKGWSEIHAIYGYRFGKHTFFGVGSGIHWHSNSGRTNVFVPAFGDLRFYLQNDTVTPFINANFGWSFGVGDVSGWDGPFINPSIGANIYLQNSVSLDLSIGYMLQELYKFVPGNGGFTFSNTPGGGGPPILSHHIRSYLHAVSLTVGLTF